MDLLAATAAVNTTLAPPTRDGKDGADVLRLELRGRPPLGTFHGTLTRDATTGQLVFATGGFKVVVPPSAVGHPPLPIDAVLRIQPSPTGQRHLAQLQIVAQPDAKKPSAGGHDPTATAAKTPARNGGQDAPLARATGSDERPVAASVKAGAGATVAAPVTPPPPSRPAAVTYGPPTSTGKAPTPAAATVTVASPARPEGQPVARTTTAQPNPAQPSPAGATDIPPRAGQPATATANTVPPTGPAPSAPTAPAPTAHALPATGSPSASVAAAPASVAAATASPVPAGGGAAPSPPSAMPPPVSAPTPPSATATVAAAPTVDLAGPAAGVALAGPAAGRSPADGDAPSTTFANLRHGDWAHRAGRDGTSESAPRARTASAAAPFSPPILARGAPLPAPALPTTVALSVTRLAALTTDREAVKGTRLQIINDGLPQALVGAALPLHDVPGKIVVAIGEDDDEQAAADAPPRRLVVELELPALGRVRLDGLADGGRFDVLMAPVAEELRPGLKALWALVREHTGLEGDLGFVDRPEPTP